MLIHVLFTNDDINYNITIQADLPTLNDLLHFNKPNIDIHNDNDFLNNEQITLNKLLSRHYLKMNIFEIIKNSKEYDEMIKGYNLYLKNIYSIILIDTCEYYEHSIKHYKTTNIRWIDFKTKKDLMKRFGKLYFIYNIN
jgi:hypothetical protein